MTAAILGVAAFGALGGIALNAQTASFTATQRTLGSGFDSPGDVAVDSSGNLFVADSENNAVKEILAAGGYTTVNQLAVANGNFSGPSGAAVDGSGNVFVADRENAAVKEIVAAGGYTTVRTLAVTNGHFHNPTAVAVDASGNVFVADQGNPPFANPALEEILAAGGYTTVNMLAIPNGIFTTPIPNGVAVDASDNVFVTYLSQAGVQEFLASGGYTTVNTLAAASGFFSGVAVDASDNLFVAGYTGLDEILAAGGYTTVETLGGGFSRLYAAAVGASGTIYVAEFGKTGIVEVQPGGADFGPVNVKTASQVLSLVFTFATGGTLGSSTVLTQGATGLDFADAHTGTCLAAAVYASGATCTIDVTLTPGSPGVRLGAAELLDSSGNVLATAPLTGIGMGPQVSILPGTSTTIASGLSFPIGTAVDGKGDVFIAEDGTGNVYKETLSGGVYSQSTIASGFIDASTVAVDGSGNVYISDHGTVYKETLSNGSYSQSMIVSGPGDSVGIAVDGSGNLYLADQNDSLVYKETLSNGSYTQTQIGTGFTGPTGVAVDGGGNLYIADKTGGGVYKETVQSDGSYVQTTIASGLSEPESVAVDAGGNLYIAAFGVGDLYKEVPQANGSYVQSTAVSGLTSVWWVELDAHGNLYLTTSTGSVSMIDVTNPLPLSFSATAVGSTSTDSPQTVTVSNIGNAALSIPVPDTGTNPITPTTNFSLDASTTCPVVSSSGTAGTVAVGGSCVYAINFVPAVSGAIALGLSLTDTNLNEAGPSYATQNLTLRGTGTAPDVTQITVSALPSPVTVGQPVTLTAVVSDTTTPATVPTGEVSFTDTVGTTVVSLNNGTAVPLVAGTATLQVTPTVVGTHTITANFVGATLEPNVRLAPHKAKPIFGSSSGTATLTVTRIVPTLSFGPIVTKTNGNPPFAVSATSASTGAVTYTVVSGPATIAGNLVTLTGAGTVMLGASQVASGNYAAATATTSFIVAAAPGATVPTLAFAPIPAQTFGNVPFAVSATSASSGAVTYTVVSGPATIAGNTVTLTGPGTVVLSASQAASGNYSSATATTSFPVAPAPGAPVGFTLTTSSGVESVLPGGTVAFNLTLAPGGSTYPDALTLSASGLPAGATATFSPATIPAGSGATPITMTIQTVNQQTAHGAKPFLDGSLGSMALAVLLLPIAGIKPVRRRLRQLPGLPMVLAAAALSLGAMVCLSGCGSGGVGFFNQAPKSYTVVVTATSAATGAHSSTNVTLTVQ